MSDSENAHCLDTLATLTVLLMSDVNTKDESIIANIKDSLSDTPIVSEVIAWLTKPYQPYYWPQGDRPPVGIFAPRIRHNRDADKRDRSKGRRNERPDNKRRRPERFDSSNLKSKAIKNADFAISKMKRDKKLSEFELSPFNSFYRRIQHQHIVDNGFDSYSVGDGPDRKVVIKRK